MYISDQILDFNGNVKLSVKLYWRLENLNGVVYQINFWYLQEFVVHYFLLE